MPERPRPPFPDQPLSPPGVEQNMSPSPQYEGKDYKAAGKLKGKVALITGGDSGIGRSVAYLFAREGAHVAITHLPAEREDAAKIAQRVKELGSKFSAIEADVSSLGSCREIVTRVVDEFGQIDILVNNAAYQNHVEAIEELDLDQWDHTFKVNIYGYFYMVKAALPHMQSGSVILNTGSVTGFEGSAGLLDYSATKGAIHSFTKSLAKMLVDRGIRVNCVAPGPVWTPLNPAERKENEIKDFGKKVPLGRPAQPDEIAPAFVFLASNGDSSYITGEVLAIMGGQTTGG